MKTPEEAYNIRIASDLCVNGNHVYFSENWIEKDEYASSVYRYNGSETERVTFGNHEKKPAFHDGSLYYISYDKEKQRIMRMDNLKEPREIYSNKSISDFIFYGGDILAITADPFDEKEPFATDRIKYRFNGRGLLRKKNKLVRIGKETQVLVEGDFDVNDVRTNGSRVIFSASLEDDDYAMQDIYDLDVEKKEYRKITDGKGTVSSICLTGDGTVAYVGHRNGLSPWASEYLIFPEKKVEVKVGRTASSSVGSDMFVSGEDALVHDGGSYYMIGQDGGVSSIYSYDGSEVRRVTPDRVAVREFDISSGKFAYAYSTPEKPSVLSFGSEFDLNPEVHGRIPERIEVDGKEAWFMLSGKDNPTVLAVHGGPHTAYGYAYFIEFNYLADNGFNILFGNPRGSDGYGDDFAKACVGDWGGGDFEDLLKFMDEAREKFSIGENFAITGGSYGGFMTNAAITKTDRFRCGISERSVSNLFSMCGTSDIGFWFNAIESSVQDPWSEEGMARLNEMSPVTHAKKAKTPTMFIHGEEDYRCPIEQSEQMYTALRMNGVDSVLVRYPGDSHEHARRGVPKNMRDRLQRKLDWFRKYCGQ